MCTYIRLQPTQFSCGQGLNVGPLALMNLISGCFSSQSTEAVVPINLVHKSNTIIAFILIINMNLFRAGIWFSDVLVTEALL